jgi:DNA-binding CsgD family transcriptional regulator
MRDMETASQGISKQEIADREFADLWKRHGSPILIAKITGHSPRSVMNRRRSVEARLNIHLPAWNSQREGALSIIKLAAK